MKKHKYKQSKLYWHEALDRSAVIAESFETFVFNHPAIKHDKELFEMAGVAMVALDNLYQSVGRKSFDFNKRKRK